MSFGIQSALVGHRTSDSESVDALQVSLLKMGDILLKNSMMILAGDFNAPDINWPNLESLNYLSSPSEKLLEMVDKHNLKQLVEFPTKHHGTTHNILDLVFTYNAGLVSSVEVVPGISDHDMILFLLKHRVVRKRTYKGKVQSLHKKKRQIVVILKIC